MNTALHGALTTLESSLTALLTSLTSSPTASSAPAATLALFDADDALSNALNTLRTHQRNYARILRLRAEAGRLEERIKGVVREIGELGDEIEQSRGSGYTYGEDGEEESDYSDDEVSGGDVRMGTDGDATRGAMKEVDYKTLLDFARRISRYNVQAAADAAAGIGHRENGTEGEDAGQKKDDGLAVVTQEATMWLDENANQTRDVWLLPYPTEDRIRMGLMGQLQAMAAEHGVDIETEVDKLLRTAAEGGSISFPAAAGQNEGAGGAGAVVGMYEPGQPVEGIPNGGGGPSAPATFDLDLYDPDDDL